MKLDRGQSKGKKLKIGYLEMHHAERKNKKNNKYSWQKISKLLIERDQIVKEVIKSHLYLQFSVVVKKKHSRPYLLARLYLIEIIKSSKLSKISTGPSLCQLNNSLKVLSLLMGSRYNHSQALIMCFKSYQVGIIHL